VTNEGEVYFCLYGKNFEPSEVTRLLGLEPTSVRREASPIPKHSSWNLSSGVIKNDLIDVYELSSALVSLLIPHAERICVAKRDMNLEAVLQVVLWITIDETKSTPAIGFEPEVISFLSAVGASIDVDTYRNVP
jgi:hypothetical protein